jgi:hypothetical protein
MKTLIVHYSNSGNNSLLAKNLRNVLPNSYGMEVRAKGKRKDFSILLDLLFNRNPAVEYEPVNWQDYSKLILCSPVWNYKVAHPLRSFLRAERSDIPAYAFISICSGREEQQQKLENQLTSVLGKKPLFVHQLLLSSFLENKNVKTLEHPELKQEDFDKHRHLLEDVVARLQRENQQID